MRASIRIGILCLTILSLAFATEPAARAEALAASFISQEVPPRMALGETYSVSITMQNDGTEPWTDDGAYFLQAMHPRNHADWGEARINVPSGKTVHAGEQVTFTFDVTAPQDAEPRDFIWWMKKLGGANFGDLTELVVVDVGEPELEATFEKVSIPARLDEGERHLIHLEVINTGNTTWHPSTNLLFQAAQPLNNRVWGVRRVDFELSEPVQPGELHRQSFEVAAPRKPGVTPIRWVVKQLGGDLYSEVSPDKSIEVLRRVRAGVRFNPWVHNSTAKDSVGTKLPQNYHKAGPAGEGSVREQVQAHLSQISEATELTHILLSLGAHFHLPWDDTVNTLEFDNLVLLIEDAQERGLGTMLELGHACTVPAEVMPVNGDLQERHSLCGHFKYECCPPNEACTCYVHHGNAKPTKLDFDIPFVPTQQNYIVEARRFYFDLIQGLKQRLSQEAYENLELILRGNHLETFGAEVRLNVTDPYLDWTLAYLEGLIPYLQENTDVSLSLLGRLYAINYSDPLVGYEHLSLLYDRPSILDNINYLAITTCGPNNPAMANPHPEAISAHLQELSYKVMVSDFALGGGGAGAPPPPATEKADRIDDMLSTVEAQGFNDSFYIWSYQGTKNHLREPGRYATASEGWLEEPLAVISAWVQGE